MFDIGFSELMVIGIVALVVIGPERLPKVARTVGGWLGKLNRYAAQVKDDVNREMKLEELKKLQAEMRDSAQKYEIIAAETEVAIKRDLNPDERLSVALGVTDSPEAQQAKVEAAQPHAIIEYARPAIDRLSVEDSLNEAIEADEMTLPPPLQEPELRDSDLSTEQPVARAFALEPEPEPAARQAALF
ncbi:MAG: twin-arginine translocase subunit TatB [Betaproteobacteria bacterium]|nr:MAG: twin-arginine translocase subunit TatB [Betaproteobacteria bacterium]